MWLLGTELLNSGPLQEPSLQTLDFIFNYVYARVYAVSSGAPRRFLERLELEFQAIVNHPTWVLGIECVPFKSSVCF